MRRTGVVRGNGTEKRELRRVMADQIRNRKLCFCGKLAGMSRKDAERLARDNGAQVVPAPRGDIDLVVIGEAVPLGKTWVELSAAFDDELRNAFESGRLETVTETTFWQWLGLSPQTSSPQLYTPAALAQLAGVPAAAIRHWHRAGLLKPESQVGKLPYFAFSEILAAKRLKALTEAGYSLRRIARAIDSLSRDFPQTERVLLYLYPTSDPAKILYADGRDRRDSGGQAFFDFEGLEAEEPFLTAENPLSELSGAFPSRPAGTPEAPPLFPEPSLLSDEERRLREDAVDQKVVALCQKAWEEETAGDIPAAVQSCRSALLLGGADPDISFQLAELLARCGSLEAARERYYVVLESDDRHLEALVGLARVLDRLGEAGDAARLYRTALEIHPGYAAVRYRLGEILYRLGERAEAEEQLLLFKAADPDSLLGGSADEILRQIARSRAE